MNNRYYVYVHRRKDNGDVFYLGKGTRGRFKTQRRNKQWVKVKNEAGGFTAEILHDNLSEDSALNLETSLLNNPDKSWKLVNKYRNTRNIKFSKDDISEYLEYDESSPTCLRWKKWNNSKIKKTSRQAGDVAGYIVKDSTSKSYYSVRVSGKSLLVHRIVWTLLVGEIPEGFVINHINSDGKDNRILNLTCITQKHNAQQTSRQKKYGVGVQELSVKGHTYAVASWTDNEGVVRSKLFPYSKYGKDEAHILAIEHRKTELLELNKQGADYLILQN